MKTNINKLICLLFAVLLVGCSMPEQTNEVVVPMRRIVQKKTINDINYMLVCEVEDGKVISELCGWLFEDWTSAPFEYYVPDIPLLGSPLGIRKV